MGGGQGGALCVGLPPEADIRKASETSHDTWGKPVIIIVYFLQEPPIPACDCSTFQISLPADMLYL